MSPVKTELIEKDLIFVRTSRLAQRATFSQTMPTSFSEKSKAIIYGSIADLSKLP